MRKEGGDNSWFPAVQNSVRSVSLVLFVLKAESRPYKSSDVFPRCQNTVQEWSSVRGILSTCEKTPCVL